MKVKIYCLSLLLGILIMTGCTRFFDSSGYVAAMTDALYKGDYGAYAQFTGISTAEVSQYRDQWLSNTADNFITIMGSGNPSDEMRSRITDLLKKIYANAKYEITNEENGDVQMTIWPIDLITRNCDTLQAYVTDFNTKNDTFAFSSMSEEEFYDTYLEGIITILESHLAELSYQEPVQLNISICRDENGLYTIDSKTLAGIQENILQWPDAEY